MNDSAEASLSNKSTITIGLVILLVASIGGYTIRSESRMNEVEDSVNARMTSYETNFNERMTAIEISVNKIADSIQSAIGDRWTITMQAEHALRQKLANPEMNIPDPRRPGHYIQSGKGPS